MQKYIKFIFFKRLADCYNSFIFVPCQKSSFSSLEQFRQDFWGH